MSYDALIESIVSSAEIAAGIDPRWLPGRVSRPRIATPAKIRPAPWRKDEIQFLQENITRLTIEEIANALRRSTNAVKIRQVRECIPAKSRQPGYLTGGQVCRVLGVDIHAVMKLSRRGLLPMEVLPGERGILRISKIRLYMWATNWRNWIYFTPAKMRDLHLRGLVELAQSRWGDEWWSTGKAAKHLGVTSNSLLAYIQRHKLPVSRWYNWQILKSVVDTITIRPHKGSAQGSGTTPRQDEFMLRAAREGKTCEEISRMMKWKNTKAVNHRLRVLGYRRTPQWIFEKRRKSEQTAANPV